MIVNRLHILTLNNYCVIISLPVNGSVLKGRNMNNFTLISKKQSNEEGDFETYGIRCNCFESHLVIEDITTEWDQIDYILNAFNTFMPEEVHIYDILENYLLDFTDF